MSPDEQFRVLRVTIEATLAPPLQILVTSATAEDGSGELALGLARAFASAGRRAAIVVTTSSGSRSRTLAGDLDLIVPHVDSTDQSSDLDELMRDARAKYAVTVIDGGAVTTSSETLRIASAADGVLLAVRLGRLILPVDREVLPLLARVHARVLGIVTTDPGWIRLADSADDAPLAAVQRSPEVARRVSAGLV